MTQNYKPAYPPAFRQQMVELVALGKCPKQLSKEFGCHYTSIQSWCRAAGVPYGSNQIIAPASVLRGVSLDSNERQELLELRKKPSVWRWSVTYWQRLRPGLQTTRIDWEGVPINQGKPGTISDSYSL